MDKIEYDLFIFTFVNSEVFKFFGSFQKYKLYFQP
jgi:hypothetical protein